MPEGPFYEEDTILDHFTNNFNNQALCMIFVHHIYSFKLYLVVHLYNFAINKDEHMLLCHCCYSTVQASSSVLTRCSHIYLCMMLAYCCWSIGTTLLNSQCLKLEARVNAFDTCDILSQLPLYIYQKLSVNLSICIFVT